MRLEKLITLLVSTLLIFGLVFALASCGEDNTDANNNAQNGNQNNGTEDTAPDDNGESGNGSEDDNQNTQNPDTPPDDNKGDETNPDNPNNTPDNPDNTPDNPDEPEKDPVAITGVSFTDMTVDYNGASHVLTASNIPEGVTALYTDNSGTDAGVYEATVTLTGDGYIPLTLTATLTINKANLIGITLAGGVFTYDGEEKTVTTLEGTVPEGVDVSYTDNTATDVGVYTATATLTGKNYKDLILKAQLVIEKATITGISLPSLEFEYDGDVKSLPLVGTLPAGVTVKYLDCTNAESEIGTYKITCVISSRNYETLTLYAYLKIKEPASAPLVDFENVLFENGEFVYDGTVKSLEVTGSLPDGTAIEYNGNGQINAGVYQVSAVVSCEGYNTLFLNATMTIKKATIEGVVFESATYTYSGEEFVLLGKNIPADAVASYTENKGTNAGVYYATLTLSGDNYHTATYNAVLTVEKADITNVKLPSKTFMYREGTAYSLEIVGVIPEGAEVTYSNNSHFTVGTHKVMVIISGDNYNTLILEAILTITSANGGSGGIVTPEHNFG